jgi:hypothetical protein
MSNLATIVNNILADSGIDDINVVVTTGSYANPAWITSLAWTKITGTPTTLAGYGITNAYTKTQTDTLLNAKLSLSGGTMTGPINLLGNQYYEAAGVFALDANNSDIIGINGIYFDDLADNPWEGLNWYNTSTTWDSLWSASGVLYYTPNRASTTTGTSYTVYHSGNLSSPVTGTGANTRIAYWTGSGTLSGEDDFAYDYPNNRLRINSGTWSSSAATKLLVGGLLNDGSDAIAQLNGFVRIKDQLFIHNGANTAQDAYIQALGAGVLTIGNTLLINTSSVSSYQLDVNGGVRFYTSEVDSRNNLILSTFGTFNLELTNPGTGGSTWQIGATNDNFASGGNRLVFTYGASSLNSVLTLVQSTGNVGIGRNDPNFKLDVNGTGRFSGTITGGANLELTNAGGSYLLVGEGTGVNQYAAIDWDATNNRLRIATQPYAFGANGGQITLTTTGLVGIGILAPSYKLDVNGGVNNDQARFVAASGDALVRIIANNYATEADARLFLGENDTLGMTFEYDGQQNIGHIGMNDSVDPTSAFSKRISMPRDGNYTLFPAGNVGIGISAPSVLLNTFKEDDLYSIQLRAQTNTSGVLSYTGIGPSFIEYYRDIATGVNLTIQTKVALASTGGGIVFAPQGTTTALTPSERMRILKDGRVGVGIDNPAADLQVGRLSDVTIAMSNSTSVTSGNRGSLAWYNSSVSTVALIRAKAITDNVGTQLEFHTRPAGSSLNTAMIILSSGRVAINDSAANGFLQVTGSHVGGYGLINMNSVDPCILSLDSSGSYDVRLRYKYQGNDLWFAGTLSDSSWRLTKGDNTTVIEATQGNNVYIANGGLQIASVSGFTGSAKFLVGSFLSSGSSAIAQFNGFIRLRDQIIIHNSALTAETYLQCTSSNALTTGGSITATSFFESSDARLKSNINDLSIDVSSIKAKIYEKDGNTEIGYLAQDVENILSGAVSKRDNGYLDLSYRQVHTAKIAALEKELAELKKQLNNK